jgi:hypothetical protein
MLQGNVRLVFKCMFHMLHEYVSCSLLMIMNGVIDAHAHAMLCKFVR